MVSMPPDGRDRRVDRRTVLRSAGAGLAVLAGTAAGEGEALQQAYLDAPRNLINRSLVVYRGPLRADEAVCEFDEPWRHPVVAPGTSAGTDSVYADLFAERRFAPGTVIAFVDRIQGCERNDTRYSGIFGEVVGQPPAVGDPPDTGDGNADGREDADGGGNVTGDGNATDAGNATDDRTVG